MAHTSFHSNMRTKKSCLFVWEADSKLKPREIKIYR